MTMGGRQVSQKEQAEECPALRPAQPRATLCRTVLRAWLDAEGAFSGFGL